MIGRITGTLLEKNPPQILVDVHGVGYEIDVPMSTFYNPPAPWPSSSFCAVWASRHSAWPQRVTANFIRSILAPAKRLTRATAASSSNSPAAESGH